MRPTAPTSSSRKLVSFFLLRIYTGMASQRPSAIPVLAEGMLRCLSLLSSWCDPREVFVLLFHEFHVQE